MIIACLGIGSEYVLHPIAIEAERRGHQVVEIDMYDHNWRGKARALQPREFILITSHHPYLDSWLHNAAFGFDADIEALPTFIAVYQPLRSYFVPHDLTSPISPDEFPALYLFDGLLMPDERYWFLRDYVVVTAVGWIKSAVSGGLSHNPVAVLPSEIAYFLREPPERFITLFAPVFKHKPRVKFARFEGGERLEAIARQLGGDVVDAALDSSLVLDSTNCIITNSISSIVMEARQRGLPVLCLVDGIHPIEVQRRYISPIAGADLLPSDMVDDWISHHLSLPRSEQIGYPFDFDLLFQAIGLGED